MPSLENIELINPTASPAPVDAALDLAQQLDGKQLSPEHQAAARLSKLAGLLRGAGALAIISAAAAFLIQRWNVPDHCLRYFLFLGFTLILGLAGVISGVRIRDDKSARTFLAIAAAIVPVHFCILGALIFSQFGQPLHHYDELLHWHARSGSAAVLTMLVGLAALIPLTVVGLMALVRKEVKLVATVYLGACALLLLPFRDPSVVALLLAVGSPLLLLLDLKLRENSLFHTLEGKLARIMLQVPLMLILIRTLTLYSFSDVLVGTLWGLLALNLFHFLPKYGPAFIKARFSQGLSVLPAFIGWSFFHHALISTVQIPSEFSTTLFGLPFAALLLALSRCAETGHNYRRLAILFGSYTVLAQLFLAPALSGSLIAVAATLFAAVYSFLNKDTFSFSVGCIAFLLAVLYNLRYALLFCTFSPWVSLALIGCATVGAATFVERNRTLLQKQLASLKTEVASWN